MKKIISLVAIVVLGIVSVKSQTLQKDKQYNVACIGFYNVENLFDTLNTNGYKDLDFSPEGKNHWNTKSYWEKMDNLSKVISQMGTEFTPDGVAILGVAEVENRSVLEDLVKNDLLKKQNYQIIHYDSPDHRGIDVALLYQPKYFKVLSSKTFTVNFPDSPNYHTRDQLLVTGLLNGEKVHVIVAHWPSRSGGQKRSEPRRLKAAAVGKSIADSLLLDDPNAKIFYMGDLNDDPVSNSLVKVMKSKSKISKVKQDNFYNPMVTLYKKGIGSLAWHDSWNIFDQIIMSPSVVDDDLDDWSYYKVRVFNKPFMRQTEGNYKGYPKRSFSNGWANGYSDHFPVYVVLVKEK